MAGSPLTVGLTLEVLDRPFNIYLPIVSGGGGTTDSAPQIVALVVGIADYQNIGPPPEPGDVPDEWGYDLVAPYYDVQDMIAMLRTHAGVSPENIIQRTEQAATRENVITAFDELDQKEDEDTIVIFYYSGHGGQTPDHDGDESDGRDEFIAMYDTDRTPDGFERVLTDDDLQALLALLESQHIIIIIDACYSGGMIGSAIQSLALGDLQRRGLAYPLDPGVMPDQEPLNDLIGPGRVIIASGTGDQATWESGSLQNGVFTYFFLQGLQDALHDANGNSRISAEEAYWFTRDAVDDWVYANQAEHQNPDIHDLHFGQVDLTWLP